MNNTKFMIQIKYWFEPSGDGGHTKFEINLGPFETKAQMNAEMHRTRDFFSKRYRWNFTNHKQMSKFKFRLHVKWSNYPQYHYDIIGWKKIRSNNRRFWDTGYKPRSEISADPKGNVCAFWRTIPIITQSESEIIPVTLDDFVKNNYRELTYENGWRHRSHGKIVRDGWTDVNGIDGNRIYDW